MFNVIRENVAHTERGKCYTGTSHIHHSIYPIVFKGSKVLHVCWTKQKKVLFQMGAVDMWQLVAGFVLNW